MADLKVQKVNVDQIAQLRKQIVDELSSNLTEDGSIDLIQLRENNEPLAEIFDLITLSKTWRDDPFAFSKDVARMISARDSSSSLSEALNKLEEKLAVKKSE